MLILSFITCLPPSLFKYLSTTVCGARVNATSAPLIPRRYICEANDPSIDKEQLPVLPKSVSHILKCECRHIANDSLPTVALR